jgi:sugar phosphate isomerase/epimerase
MTFTNLPLRYIEEHPHFLDLFLTRGLSPELGLDALALDTFSADWHKKTARIFHNAGLTCAVHLPFFDLRPGSLDPMIRKASQERLLQAVDAARVYDPAHFIAHLDYHPVIYSHFEEAWLENSLGTWEMVLDRAASVPLFLENVFEPNPEHHVRVLRELAGRAGACLDVGHWHCFAGGSKRGNLMEWIAALSPFRLHLHLHDNDGQSDAHLGLGEGSIPWDQLWTGLTGREFTTTFEPHTEAAFQATQDYLRAHDLKF